MSAARTYGPILLVGVALAALPLAVHSNAILNGLVTALIIALAGQGWNLLGGYGGQFSFGHAAFFGSGAYADAVLQARYGVNAYVALPAAVAVGGAIGWILGFLSFRAGLRGSYFALITLAFSEVFKIVANASPLTGGAAGVLIKLNVSAANFQFASRAVYFWIVLAAVIAATLFVRAIERRRFGAYLAAIRENENAAAALGVDTLRVKLAAITISAAITATAGAFYVQYFLFVNSSIAYGTWISIDALLAPIIGGLGTAFGPLLGALALHFVGEFARSLGGQAPGVDLALFGVLLIVIVAFARDGLQGALVRLTKGLRVGRPA